jgi:hypothetical protein
VSAPAFAEIASYAVRHFGIAPPPEVSAADAYQKPDLYAPITEERVVSQPAERVVDETEIGDPADQGNSPLADTADPAAAPAVADAAVDPLAAGGGGQQAASTSDGFDELPGPSNDEG